ncbi:MAG: hypothetical protein KDK62_05785 [Chlamydiia bacterium]|nr:hypothetical protein [Chlamydiia bacterium]
MSAPVRGSAEADLLALPPSVAPATPAHNGRSWKKIGLAAALAVTGVVALVACVVLVVFFPPSVLAYVSATGCALFLGAKIAMGLYGVSALIGAAILAAKSSPKKSLSEYQRIQ